VKKRRQITGYAYPSMINDKSVWDFWKYIYWTQRYAAVEYLAVPLIWKKPHPAYSDRKPVKIRITIEEV